MARPQPRAPGTNPSPGSAGRLPFPVAAARAAAVATRGGSNRGAASAAGGGVADAPRCSSTPFDVGLTPLRSLARHIRCLPEDRAGAWGKQPGSVFLQAGRSPARIVHALTHVGTAGGTLYAERPRPENRPGAFPLRLKKSSFCATAHIRQNVPKNFHIAFRVAMGAGARPPDNKKSPRKVPWALVISWSQLRDLNS